MRKGVVFALGSIALAAVGAGLVAIGCGSSSGAGAGRPWKDEAGSELLGEAIPAGLRGRRPFRLQEACGLGAETEQFLVVRRVRVDPGDGAVVPAPGARRWPSKGFQPAKPLR